MSALERLFLEIDSAEDLTPELVKKCLDIQASMSRKVDNWINFLDACKEFVITCKDRKKRAEKALKMGEAMLDRGKDYLKYVIQNNPDVPYRGEEGTLYLHKNPKGLKVDLTTANKTFYDTVSQDMMRLEPGLGEYVKEISVYVLDREKLKTALLDGKEIPWARIHQDCHVRVK